ncbi:TNF receptor-associated factor 3-like [Ylistrum balloti]|uniref:TNF receptor-associated factor 3-like n=1 Tax=Ylistrum balloti TaxID=509963 RepID=UPI002905C0EB|nr:TNF receptor-associated factor 3-like [Ylistrum balloti]XP_060063096.1 TNF receptor-associated factor 3-like [Ylistrum balloti]
MSDKDSQSSMNVFGPSLTLSSSDHLTATLENLSLSSSIETPGDTPEFVHLDPSCHCIHCKLVVRDALQLICGHHVCKRCLNPLFGDQEHKRCPEFEDCGYDISKAEVFPDTYKRREVLNQKVFCTFKSRGCDAVVAWKDLKNHVLRCMFAIFPCLRASEGCTAILTRDQFDSHINGTCDFLPVTCDHCKEITLRGKFMAHIETDCPKVMIHCPYLCGAPEFPREQLETHEEQCPNKPILCSFSCIGCKFKGVEEVVKQHEKNDMASHLLLLSTYTSKMEDQNKTISAELLDLKQEKEKWQQQAIELEGQCNDLKKENAAAKKSANELRLMIASQGERGINLERKIEDKASKTVADKLVRDVTAIRETNQSLGARITNLERAGPIVGEVMGPAQVNNKLRHLDKQYTLHDVRLAELDLRFQILETANFEGVLMWKIRDYNRRRQEAVNGRTLSLFSQPFYTGRHGYKMCGRVYLNGDGTGKETHLSFFFVIMKGDYDALLPWPFKQRVSLMLKDQDTRTQDICDTFTPNAVSNSFKRPETEMNVASGVPKFIAHNRLETPTYVQDDTIYLMIKVDTSNIPNHPNP